MGRPNCREREMPAVQSVLVCVTAAGVGLWLGFGNSVSLLRVLIASCSLALGLTGF